MLSASGSSLVAVSPLDLLGVPEIAEMLGVSRPSVWRYVRRDDFPEPDARYETRTLPGLPLELRLASRAAQGCIRPFHRPKRGERALEYVLTYSSSRRTS
jgi:hypothetical protein